MNKQIKYEILDSLPAYGPMYIPISGNGEDYFSEGFVVRIFKSDGTDWVANFKPGWTALNAVHQFEGQSNLVVIAGGTCYIIDPESTTPVKTFGADYRTIINTMEGDLILQNSTSLSIIEMNGEIWHTERISFDGIKDLTINDQLVKGLSFNPISRDDEWIEFIVDLKSRIVEGGSYRN